MSSLQVEPPSIDVSLKRPETRLARNVASTIAVQLLTWAMSFAVVLFLPAYVGPSGMGKLALATSISGLIAAIVPLGTSTVLVKAISREPSRGVSLLSASLLLRIPLSLLSMVAVWAISRAMHFDRESTTLVMIYAAGAALSIVNDALVSTLQGLERLTRQNAVAAVEKLAWAGLTIAVVFARGGLWQIAAVVWLSSTIAIAGNLSEFLSSVPGVRFEMPSLADVRSMAIAGVPFLGWSLCVAMYGQTDPIVIRAVTGRDLDVGWYGVATKLVGTTLFLPAAFLSALLPRLSRLHRDDPEEFRRLSTRALSMSMLVGLPIAAALGVMPDRLLRLLPYGHRFDEVVPVLRVGGPGLLLWYLGIMLGAFVMARDEQGRMFRAAMAAAIVSMPLCWLFSRLTFASTGNAATGAIASDCLIELSLVICYAWMLPKNFVDGRFYAFTARAILASLLTVACLSLAFAHGAGLWSILVGVIVYLILCKLLGCISPNDLLMIRRLVSRRANGEA